MDSREVTKLAVRIPSDLHRRIKILSVELGIPLQDLVRQALEDYLQKHSGQAPAK
jgi:predicted DNA binding CopG/RHH family protein